MLQVAKNKKSNFFICFTPLHVLLAQRIKTEKMIASDYFLYISESTSEKNKRYFTMLQKDSGRSFYFRKGGVFNNLFTIIRLFIKLRSIKGTVATIYVTNIKTFYSRIFVWFLSPDAIVTFDDGIGNINVSVEGAPRSYFANPEENKWVNFFFTVVNKKLLYKNLVQRIEKHYTIYKLPNIFKNAEYIEMFRTSENSRKKTKKLTLLLTSALALENYMTEIEESSFYDKLISTYGVDMIIRHPRNESYVPMADCKVSDSLNIAEHQILELATTYELFVVSVFYSSVLLHIPSDIRKVNIITTNPKKDHPELRKLHDFLSIQTLDFDLSAS